MGRGGLPRRLEASDHTGCGYTNIQGSHLLLDWDVSRGQLERADAGNPDREEPSACVSSLTPARTLVYGFFLYCHYEANTRGATQLTEVVPTVTPHGGGHCLLIKQPWSSPCFTTYPPVPSLLSWERAVLKLKTSTRQQFVLYTS